MGCHVLVSSPIWFIVDSWETGVVTGENGVKNCHIQINKIWKSKMYTYYVLNVKGPGWKGDRRHFGHFEIFNISTSCRMLKSGEHSSLLFSFRVKTLWYCYFKHIFIWSYNGDWQKNDGTCPPNFFRYFIII